MIRGMTRWWRTEKRAVLPYVCAICCFPLPYYLTHSSMDYRQPLEPIIVLLVTIGLVGIGSEASAKSSWVYTDSERVTLVAS